MSRLLSWDWLVLITTCAVCAGCPVAPLAGKICPCTADYFCCTPTQICTLKTELEKCRCPSAPLVSDSVTTNGKPLPGEPEPDAATDGQLIFGDSPERWASYVFEDPNKRMPLAILVPDRDGFHFTADFTEGLPDSATYQGFGLSYVSAKCIDGSGLSGVQFEVSGNLGGQPLLFSVTSADQVTPDSDPLRGICQGTNTTCFGAGFSIAAVSDTPTMVSYPFSKLTGGNAGPLSMRPASAPDGPTPGTTVDVTQIVNVQWMVRVSAALDPDFTIQNVSFY